MIILLTGGSGCGKSSFAEKICMAHDMPRYYIAAMQPLSSDGLQKVDKHRAMRAGKGFETFERYTDLEHLIFSDALENSDGGCRSEADASPHGAASENAGNRIVGKCDGSGHLKKRGTALLECICNLTANEMYDEKGNESDPRGRVLAGVENLERQCDTVVIVTNDVGSDGDEYDESTRRYVQYVGDINRELAQRADVVIEMVCGIPIEVKGTVGMTGVALD